MHVPFPVTLPPPPTLSFWLRHTLLRRVEGRVEALEELLEVEFPVSVLIRQLDESINAESSETQHKGNVIG